MEKFIHENQEEIVRQLEKVDGKKFQKDTWNRPKGGGGITCVLQDGNVFEKAGVNTSVVYGTLPRAAIAKMRVHHRALDAEVESLEFFAAGISLVLHPHNPHAPTVHLNYRYFETENPSGSGTGAEGTWWFGGGTDLTPSILYEEDAKNFHQGIKQACDNHDRTYYPRFKKWCDKYFYIPHRGETRGIGGIFFDDLDSSTADQEHLFSFVTTCLTSFLPTYIPILNTRKDTPFTAQQKRWQQLRRGRYVEFNLVHDRGTAFGLNTPGARIESILMSLPLTARWEYVGDGDVVEQFEGSGPDTRDVGALMKVLREPREWV